jgi:hypothetical protein
VSAEAMNELRSGSNEAAFEKVFADALFKTYIVKARVKQEKVQEEMRTKSSAARLDEIDLVDECSQMLQAIKKYSQ